MTLHLNESQVALAKLRVEKRLEAAGHPFPRDDVDDAMAELEEKAYIGPCPTKAHGRCLRIDR